VDSIDSALREIFRHVFQVSKMGSEDSIETISLWDSMGHMTLMAAIEKRFNIRIEAKDIIQLTSVKAIKEYVEART
jgi:acyl carrier protein